jgi:hypothetical protein
LLIVLFGVGAFIILYTRKNRAQRPHVVSTQEFAPGQAREFVPLSEPVAMDMIPPIAQPVEVDVSPPQIAEPVPEYSYYQ